MKIYDSVEQAFKAEFGHLEHADNFRAAEIGDSEEMAEYVRKMREGCCGTRDTVVKIKHSTILAEELHVCYVPTLLGCNYGH